ncbi:MAG: carboxyl transferase domain-containing protein [Eubacteriales bacterium]|jgi:acetyl-CoA carboxylase carboxyltransferase component|nr:carboxyl transferase domain-containing protein [Eubacteriales bacterium]
MSSVEKKAQRLQELQKRKHELLNVGQAVQGKMSARERIRFLFDEGSFVELGAFTSEGVATEGVITGYGTVGGSLVYAYVQEFSALGGAVSKIGAKKISNLLDLALKAGAPVISILDSTGVRITEGSDVLFNMGQALSKTTKLSGVVPHISVVLGPCAGGSIFIPGLADFVFMVDNLSYIFMTGPEVTSGTTGKEIDAESLGGAKVCAANGVADFVYPNEEECFLGVKKLLEYLPANNLEETPLFAPSDSAGRLSENILPAVSGDGPSDMVQIINEIADSGSFFEIGEKYADNIITGFILLDGVATGVIANRPAAKEGVLDIDACKKASKFIRICDAFNIQVLTLVDTSGFAVGEQQEHGGISKYGASLLFAYAEASVPKVTLVVGRSYGSSHMVLGSKSAGADMVLALPIAEVSILQPEAAANILYKDEIAASDDPISARSEKTAYYADNIASPFAVSESGIIDDVIEPENARPRLISAFDMLFGKRESRIPKKHGTMPV